MFTPVCKVPPTNEETKTVMKDTPDTGGSTVAGNMDPVSIYLIQIGAPRN